MPPTPAGVPATPGPAPAVATEVEYQGQTKSQAVLSFDELARAEEGPKVKAFLDAHFKRSGGEVNKENVGRWLAANFLQYHLVNRDKPLKNLDSQGRSQGLSFLRSLRGSKAMDRFGYAVPKEVWDAATKELYSKAEAMYKSIDRRVTDIDLAALKLGRMTPKRQAETGLPSTARSSK
jgi:hypothetical protein